MVLQSAGPPGSSSEQRDHTHADLENARRLLSIGIDVGSATSHFAVSELYVGKRDPRMAGKPEVLHRHLLYESPILLTPFVDGTSIDVAALERFLRDECECVGLDLDAIDTGALICTGEAARKENAAAISEQLAAESGKFVAATAGHHLEAVLGAFGSGAVQDSRGRDHPLVLLDVGGGTAKRTLMQDGRILHTAALNIGSRLIAWDEQSRVRRLEEAGARIAKAAGHPLGLGDVLDDNGRDQIARRMAACLAQFLSLAPYDDLTDDLLLTDAPPLPDHTEYMLGGGLAEYYYGREQRDLGDLGLQLSRALRAELDAHGVADHVLPSDRGIRATVIGAGQFTVQVSGETVFIDGGLKPPLRRIPVHAVPLDWSHIEPVSLREMLARALAERPPEGPVALAFSRPRVFGYGAAQQLAHALAQVLPELPTENGIVLVFHHNVARTIGSSLATARVSRPFMCLDELEVGDLEYLDVGEPVAGEDYLPVVVKSLVFSGPATPGHHHHTGEHRDNH